VIALAVGIFISGVLSGSIIKISFPFIYLLSLGLLLLLIRRKDNWLIFALIFLLGTLCIKNANTLASGHFSEIFDGGGEVSLGGVIVSDPVYKYKRATFILDSEALKHDNKWHPVSGKVLVKGRAGDKFYYGAKVLLTGRITPTRYLWKGFGRSLKNKQIYAILYLKKNSFIRVLDKNRGNLIMHFALSSKAKIERVISNNLSYFSSAILNAIILGDRVGLPQYIKDYLVKAGTVHVISISGLHLAIVSFIVLLFFKILRIPRDLRYILTVLFIIIYSLLTGARVPGIRAAIMVSIYLFGLLFRRESNIYNSLSLAALIILAINPSQLFELSFQLSFLSVLSIVWISPKIKGPKLFSVSFASWLGILPLIAYYFRIISPVAILANMIIVPYMVIIVALGFLLILVGIIFPQIAFIFATTCEIALLILVKINAFLAGLPLAYFMLPQIHLSLVFIYYTLLILLLTRLSQD